jgi:diguanylate cyclase (GGDEF)-like protein
MLADRPFAAMISAARWPYTAATMPAAPSVHPLEAENQALRRQLQSLLQEARANEDKMRRFEQLEHRLIGAASLQELLQLLLQEYRQVFAIDQVSLALVDGEREMARLLGGAPPPGLRLLADAAPLLALYGSGAVPLLDRFDAARHGELFAVPLASVALLPIHRHGRLIASLHFGSTDAQRYTPDAGTQLLQRLAGIVGVCLESALNQERLKLAGLTDMLTGVHNRRYFEHRCAVEIAQARRHRQGLACLFLDIDGFKAINDGHGHAAGDAVLRAVGQAIQGQLRAGDTIARWGGEEFVALLPQAALAPAREIAERIRAHIAAQPVVAGAANIPVTISIGLAQLGGDLAGREPAQLAEQLLAAADRALYRAKHAGRNRVAVDGA